MLAQNNATEEDALIILFFTINGYVIDPEASSHRTLSYPDAITGETFTSLCSLLDFKDFKLTAIHVAAKPLIENTNAPGLIKTPDISIVGAYDPSNPNDVVSFLNTVELVSGGGQHFMGNVLDIRLENGDLAHFQPYPLTYHGNLATPDYL